MGLIYKKNQRPKISCFCPFSYPEDLLRPWDSMVSTESGTLIDFFNPEVSSDAAGKISGFDLL